jgi:hypothetical protein
MMDILFVDATANVRWCLSSFAPKPKPQQQQQHHPGERRRRHGLLPLRAPLRHRGARRRLLRRRLRLLHAPQGRRPAHPLRRPRHPPPRSPPPPTPTTTTLMERTTRPLRRTGTMIAPPCPSLRDFPRSTPAARVCLPASVICTRLLLRLTPLPPFHSDLVITH